VKLSDVIEAPPSATAMEGLEALAKTDPVLWCAINRRVKGEPLVFDNARKLEPNALGEIKRTLILSDYERELFSRLLHHRPFLKQPLRDKHKHKVYEKGRQIGGSELMVSEEFHFLSSNPGTKLIHTFPRDKQLTDFSVTRIASVFAESPRMAALAGTPNQVFTKKIGDSYMILRSAWESNLGEGVDADMVVLDEKDRMRDKIEFAFKESLKSSKHGYFRELSTPTLPNRGIDVPYRASDQQVWMVKCERCNEWQEINWKENIVAVKNIPLQCKELPPESYEFLCRKTSCRGKLDRVYTGRWVAKYPDRKNIRGYHIPQLIAPWLSATRVMQDKIDMRFPELWLCYVCGVPAVGELELVNDEDFEAACAGHDMFTRRTKDFSMISVGIDWGTFNWVVVYGRNSINDRPYVLAIGVFEDTARELESAEMVWNFIRPFNPDIVVADAGYGKDRNSYLMRRLCPNGNEGKFYAQWYNPSLKASRTFVPVWGEPASARVLVDRTLQLKNFCHTIKEREFGMPNLEIPEVQLFIRHLKSLAPFREIDEETKELIETIKSSGDDHLAHAGASGWLGMEKLSKVSRFDFSLV
jgi:hypothetical protein